MTPIDEPASFEPKGPEPDRRKARPPSATSERQTSADLVSLMVDAATGRLISVEAVDAAGTRRELPDDLRASLATLNGALTVEGIVEQAFEAGIDCVLGGEGAAEEAGEESDDD